MALLTSWSAANRVVEQDLTSECSREAITSAASDVIVGGHGVAYWRYTRTRTKRYRYISMTKATALRCAAAMNSLYTRPAFTWIQSSGGDQSFAWIAQTATPYVYDIIPSGAATPEHEEGNAWSVVVTVNERVTIPYSPLRQSGADLTQLPAPWDDFERNPAKDQWAFHGLSSLGDFFYDDDATTGYGYVADPTHDTITDKNYGGSRLGF